LGGDDPWGGTGNTPTRLIVAAHFLLIGWSEGAYFKDGEKAVDDCRTIAFDGLCSF
jgi:hypothetical protein